ncbi:MAG: ABA4-like family protein [Pseudomonadota bacterium]|nr:ABA4-like family protein [Pseudomonadota bacterium]
MIDPALAFNLGGKLAMLGWLGLIASLFLAGARPAAQIAARLAVPALLAIAYGLLIWTGFDEARGGGFGSIAEVRALFASDSALVAGWLHYLAFDLFVGSWIVADGIKWRIPVLLILPCLPLTFLFGPLGLLLFILLRLAFRRRETTEAL